MAIRSSVPASVSIRMGCCARAVKAKHKGRISRNARMGRYRIADGRWQKTAGRRDSGVNVGRLLNAPHTNFLLALARLRDLVGGLHSHQRVHLHAESLLDA